VRDDGVEFAEDKLLIGTGLNEAGSKDRCGGLDAAAPRIASYDRLKPDR
jgi:hypothetical protein